jgi:hypothetical protein
MATTAGGSDGWPRDEANRFRIYLLSRPFKSGAAVVVATTPTREGIGVALCTLAEEGSLDGGVVGVMDTQARAGSGNVWLINPYEAARKGDDS